jgi:transcriptional regulator with XRE-family HTH domain
MSGLKTESGIISRYVGQAVKQRREQLGLSYAQLSRLLTRWGRDIPTLGLRRIEAAERRVDVDDLVALALALEVSPITLLMRPDAREETGIPLPGAGVAASAKQFWNWLTANYPMTGSVMAFYSAALPQWEREEFEQKLGGIKP